MLTKEQIALCEKLFDDDRLCEVCLYAVEGCTGGVHGGPNGPIYPPCADSDFEKLMNPDLLEDLIADESET